MRRQGLWSGCREPAADPLGSDGAAEAPLGGATRGRGGDAARSVWASPGALDGGGPDACSRASWPHTLGNTPRLPWPDSSPVQWVVRTPSFSSLLGGLMR